MMMFNPLACPLPPGATPATAREFFVFSAFWVVLLLAIATFNRYRYRPRPEPLYWAGTAVFAGAGFLAAYFHVGPCANTWGIVAAGGILTAGLTVWVRRRR